MSNPHPGSARVCVEGVTSLDDDALRERLKRTPLGRTPGMAVSVLFPGFRQRLISAVPAPVGPEPIRWTVDRTWLLTRVLMSQADISEGPGLLAKVLPGGGTFFPPPIQDLEMGQPRKRSWQVVTSMLCQGDAEGLFADTTGWLFVHDGAGWPEDRDEGERRHGQPR